MSTQLPECKFCGKEVSPERLTRNPRVRICEECRRTRVVGASVKMEVPVVAQKV